MDEKITKTLVAVLASHDSMGKNKELTNLFKELYDEDKEKLRQFHFIFTGGTFRRLILGDDTENLSKKKFPYPIDKNVRNFLLESAGVTVLSDRKEGGVVIMANLIVQRQCSIIWPFLSPITVHWLNPENLALMRLCDLWNAKRLMNAESVMAWFRDEAERDFRRNPQQIPLRITLGTRESENNPRTLLPSWPEAGREASEKLQNLPQGIKFPDPLKNKIRYDAYERRLIMREDVTPKEKADLLSLSPSDKQYKSVVRKLFDEKLSGGKLTKEYYVRLPVREHHPKEFWRLFEQQTIALIAHDAMKDRMVDFAVQYENELNRFGRILATGTTGQEVVNACRKLREGDKVRRCLSGPKGGDIEIATEILCGRCHIVVFFIDPLHPHAHIDDIRVVFSACMAEIENNDVRMLTNEVQAREWIEEAVRRRGTLTQTMAL
jgi:methylglyoxal synthase